MKITFCKYHSLMISVADCDNLLEEQLKNHDVKKI